MPATTEKKMIFQTVHGSHLYGFAHEGSDLDLYRVYEGDGDHLSQKVSGNVDLVVGDLGAFLKRAQSGSHQSVEALFSQKKEWGEGMEEKWAQYFSGLRITGPEVLDKYRRTIKKLCFGDHKRRRHAVRLYYGLSDLQLSGTTNPTLGAVNIYRCNEYAERYEGEALAKILLGTEWAHA